MTTAPTTTRTPVLGTRCWDSDNTGRTVVVVADQAIILGQGEFLLRFENTSYTFIGRLTGRTRKFFGWTCPTIERFNISTEVINGAIWGVRGSKVAGTWACYADKIK